MPITQSIMTGLCGLYPLAIYKGIDKLKNALIMNTLPMGYIPERMKQLVDSGVREELSFLSGSIKFFALNSHRLDF